MFLPDVTVIINLHREGKACVPSIRSALAAVRRAGSAGTACEVILVLDRSDQTTLDVAKEFGQPRGIQLLQIDVGDLGLARNAGVQAAAGRYLAFLDGDDLWGDEWLLRAHRAATREEHIVWHPQLSLIHGAAVRAVLHPNSDDATFDHDRFSLHNSWTALSFAARDVFLEVPFPVNRLDDGFGFEDWSWNEEILRRGLHHRTVPETFHAISLREDASSLKARSRAAVRSDWKRP